MSSTLFVSIGLYVYNGERFLEAALRSNLNQTFTDFELIISDNASTDRTGDIAQCYAKRDDRVRYYRSEKNMGAGWNLRRVYELATCKYFKWSAADDVLEREFLRLCVEILEREDDCVVAYAKPKEVDGNGTFIRNYDIPVKVDSNDAVARFQDMILIDHNCYQIFGLIRMSALHQPPPHGIYVNADRVLLSRLSLLGRFCEIPEALFIRPPRRAICRKNCPFGSQPHGSDSLTGSGRSHAPNGGIQRKLDPSHFQSFDSCVNIFCRSIAHLFLADKS
jgi:glycosyltransferase involved in cell wall biosynthesis